MVINASNFKQEQGKVYLHDSDMVLLYQNLKDQYLEIVFENHYIEFMKRTVLRFCGAVYFEMTNYCPWGCADQVHGIWFHEPVLIDRLHSLSKEFGEGYSDNLPIDKTLYMQSVITFISGDKLRILCQKIEVKEEPLIAQ